MITIPTDDKFRSAMQGLPAFMLEMGTDYNYDLVWDWVCAQCGTEWLDDDQVAILDALYDLAASYGLCAA
jgi:hypothetical protein